MLVKPISQHLLLLRAVVVPSVRRPARLNVPVIRCRGDKRHDTLERGCQDRPDVLVLEAVPDRAQSLWVPKVCHLQRQVIRGALDRYAGGLQTRLAHRLMAGGVPSKRRKLVRAGAIVDVARCGTVRGSSAAAVSARN